MAAFYMRQQDLLLAQTTSLGGVDHVSFQHRHRRHHGVETGGGRAPDRLAADFRRARLARPALRQRRVEPWPSTEQDLSGKLMPYTRRWIGNLFAEVKQPVSDQIDFVATASLRFEKGGVLGDYCVLDPYGDDAQDRPSAGVLVERSDASQRSSTTSPTSTSRCSGTTIAAPTPLKAEPTA